MLLGLYLAWCGLVLVLFHCFDGPKRRPRPTGPNLPTGIEFDSIQVINLAYREERWKSMQRKVQHDAPSLTRYPMHRFLGISGPLQNAVKMYTQGRLSRSAYRSILAPRRVEGTYVTTGSLGCYLSHVALWRQAMRASKPTIIMEDDVEFEPDFDQWFDAARSELPDDFDLFYFADLVQTEAVRNATTSFSTHLDRVWGEHWGLYAYIISPQAAQRLVEYALPIKWQIDSYLIDYATALQLRIYRSRRNLVRTNNDVNRVSDVQLNALTLQQRHMLIPPTAHLVRKDTQPVFIHQRWARNLTMMDTPQPLHRDSQQEPMDLLRLRLEYLGVRGGYIFDLNTTFRYDFERTLHGVNGLIAFDAQSQTFPILALGPHPRKLHAMVQTLIDAMKLDLEQRFMYVVDQWSVLLSTVPTKDDVLLIPIEIFQNSTLHPAGRLDYMTPRHRQSLAFST